MSNPREQSTQPGVSLVGIDREAGDQKHTTDLPAPSVVVQIRDYDSHPEEHRDYDSVITGKTRPSRGDED